jgi:tetratricopeptide (TPR) repeat protein
MSRRERRAAAKASRTTSASSAGSESSTSLYEAGLGHLRAGRNLDAQLCCERALALQADHADALHLMGLLSLQAQHYDHAVEWISRAIRQNPKHEYLLSLAATLRHQGRIEEARQVLEKALQLKPADAGLWKTLGDILIDLKRLTDALSSFQQALKLKPEYWDAANECGIILHALGRFEEALSYFNLCDTLQPNRLRTLHMRAICLCSLKGLEASLPEIRRVLALDPTSAEMPNDVGTVLQSHGQDEVAMDWFEQALEIRPCFADALHNRAVSLARVHRFDEAIAIYEHLKAANSADALADLGRAHLQLLAGDFEAGWAGREVRWKLPSSYPKLTQPMWLGNSALEGKTILIGADEGLGDTIQFARYVPMLVGRGARVIFVVQDSLHLLMSDLPGVAQCISMPVNVLPAFDMHCPTMSLPLAFGTKLDTIPAPISYLSPPAEVRVRAWERRLGPRSRLRVGLVWSGNPRHQNDRNRSLSLHALTRVLDVDATFVSLQKNPKTSDQATLLEHPEIVDLTADLGDFSDTAALVGCLDLVITVDTSVAHLSAALGCPTWILLPYTPDYRWLLDRDDSPWYPTARLFRQSKSRDYGEVLDRVRGELAALVVEKRR